MEELREYLHKYRDLFGEQFPMMACLGMEEDDIIKEIQKCLEKKQPYQYDTEQFY